MTADLRIGLVQSLTDPERPDRSRAASVEVAREALNQGADIVVLPEPGVPGYSTDDKLIRHAAEPLLGPTVQAWTELAREPDALICGGFAESDGDQLFNRGEHIAPRGERRVDVYGVRIGDQVF